MLGWEPEPYYNLTEVREHPSMPKLLKEKIGDFMSALLTVLAESAPSRRKIKSINSLS